MSDSAESMPVYMGGSVKHLKEVMEEMTKSGKQDPRGMLILGKVNATARESLIKDGYRVVRTTDDMYDVVHFRTV